MYDKLSGMTGTAETEAEEFAKIYKLDVTVIPTNRSLVRVNAPDVIYKTEREKFNAVVEDIIERHQAGSRCWSAPSRSRSPSGWPRCSRSAGSATRCSTPSSTSARRRSSPRPAARAR